MAREAIHSVKSDAEIVEEVLRGRKTAYALLVERYEGGARAVAAQILGSHHAAEEAAQEAFVTAYEKLATLRKKSAFGPWILKIVRRRAFRMAGERNRMVSLDEVRTGCGPNPNARVSEATRLVLESVSRLPGHERRVVMLKYFSGQSVRDIAAITGRPVGTITKQLSRARARLRKMLKEVES